MRYQVIFSVGDYELQDNVDFARNPKRRMKRIEQVTTKTVETPPASKLPKGMNAARKRFYEKSTPGVRKGHIRRIGGKAVIIGQSILKAGKNTAGRLSILGQQALGAGTTYAGKGAELIAKNPRTAAIAAGGTAIVGGGAYLATRKKRRRR